ncbi:MAG: hypothetical protein FWF34_00705 [Alphaproteobacteria bacterium]|nr:hypothetical protein [Alphaproteobacteria bacterium]MCL2889766.1 hypothetical protein [Alphaproteobacteria bacterium]
MHKISYAADGAQTEFAFDFPFFQHADIKIAIDNELVDLHLYNVLPNESMKGGTVVLMNAPDTGTTVDVFRKIELSRFIDYQPTAKIDPEQLNADFNFLVEALRDINQIDTDMAAWQNVHDKVLGVIHYTRMLIEDKTSGGGTIGLYNNLLSVLSAYIQNAATDYGSITDDAANMDDYGTL